MTKNNWLKARQYSPQMLVIARRILDEIRQGKNSIQAVQQNPLPEGGHIAKHVLVAAYHQLIASGEWQPDPELLERIRMKPMRSLSGVTTVTVLTQPNPCPGRCIFCPDDARMPKSYLPDEPAAARALENNFDPYAQVRSRLESLTAVGHPTDKMEMLILGGTWSAYDRDYQECFIRRCLDALNEESSTTLEEAQRKNEQAAHRNVGLAVETRPDEITPDLLAWLRRLGVTKVQMGAQSLDDRILALNCRQHDTAATLRATSLLRAAGFKIVLHWMPNLYGATLESDRLDFAHLWISAADGEGYNPDEIKIYPTQLLENAPLYAYWQRGEYTPYTSEELVDLIADIKVSIPEYCRVNRVIRDIPSNHVVAGNKRTSLRQDVIAEMKRRGQVCRCIRCREIRAEQVEQTQLQLNDLVYHAAHAIEHFISYDLIPGESGSEIPRLAGYLRLSLPTADAPHLGFHDLKGAALIREVHVYGQALPIGGDQEGAAQHSGLGTSLLDKAREIAQHNGFRRLAVIAAIGTRRYYAARGFSAGELYMVQDITRKMG